MISLDNDRLTQANRRTKPTNLENTGTPEEPNQPLEVPDQNQTPETVPEKM